MIELIRLIELFNQRLPSVNVSLLSRDLHTASLFKKHIEVSTSSDVFMLLFYLFIDLFIIDYAAQHRLFFPQFVHCNFILNYATLQQWQWMNCGCTLALVNLWLIKILLSCAEADWAGMLGCDGTPPPAEKLKSYWAPRTLRFWFLLFASTGHWDFDFYCLLWLGPA